VGRRTQGPPVPLPQGLDLVIEPTELSLEPMANDMIAIAIDPAATGPDLVPPSTPSSSRGRRTRPRRREPSKAA
jgi:hypothetical protein